MDIFFKGLYQSVSSFEWRNLPNLTILTGVNGAGKTQLLQLIAACGQNGKKIGTMVNNGILKKVDGQEVEFKIEDPDLVPNKYNIRMWESVGIPFPQTHETFSFRDFKGIVAWLYGSTHEQRMKDLRTRTGVAAIDPIQSFTGRYTDMVKGKESRMLEAIKIAAGRKSIEEITSVDITVYFPEKILLEGRDIINQSALEVLFLIYEFKKQSALVNGIPVSLQKAPYELLNEVIKAARLPYLIEAPNTEEIRRMMADAIQAELAQGYNIKLINTELQKEIHFMHLSGGEKILMSLALLDYYASMQDYYSSLPIKLVLLDEIDAHLHPSMIPDLFRVIKEVLITKYGAKVIITTHNPTTIALAPRENCSVFQLKKPTEITQDTSPNNSASINLLTNGLIVVNTSSKFVFVEDEDDVEFYSAVNSLTIQNQDLIFLPASNRIENQAGKTEVKQSGGKDAVAKWVERFDRFSEIFTGIIDRDNGNQDFESKGLHLIGRYSIENYLADPLIIFALMNNSASDVVRKPIESVGLLRGTEHTLLDKTDSELQKIANLIISMVETEVVLDVELHWKDKINADEIKTKVEGYKTPMTIEFVNGKTLTYPKWLLEHRGKNIYDILRRKTGLGNGINNSFLMANFNRLKMVPLELRDKLDKVEFS